MVRHRPRQLAHFSKQARAIAAVLAFVGLACPSGIARAADAPATRPSMEATAAALFASLAPDQRARALLPFDSPERDSEVFTGGPRPGIPLRDLDERQREMALSLVRQFTSEAGAAKCEQIAAQDPGGMGRFYLMFFGEPGPGRTYAWRVAEHHLTLVHVEIERGTPTQFGPVLLGADPPTLWDEEEDRLIALYAAMTPDERRRAAGPGRRGISSSPMPDGVGVRVSDLGPDAQAAARVVFEGRLAFLSEDVRGRLEGIVDGAGGLGAMRIAYWGTADKRCAAGGRWDFKLGGHGFLCDYENSRAHIHLSMKGRLSESAGR